MPKRAVAFVACLWAAACTTDTTEFETRHLALAGEIALPEYVGDVWFLDVFGDTLLVVDQLGDTLFTAFDTRSGEPVARGVRRGEGPAEARMSGRLGRLAGRTWFHDAGNQRLNRLVIADGIVLIDSTIPVTAQALMFDILPVRGGWAGKLIFSEDVVALLPPGADSVRERPAIPMPFPLEASTPRRELNMSHLAATSGGFALWFGFGGSVALYDSLGTPLGRSYQLPDTVDLGDDPSLRTDQTPLRLAPFAAFSDSVAAMLLCECTMGFEVLGDDGDRSVMLLRWRDEGPPLVRHVTLDRVPHAVAISEDGATLYSYYADPAPAIGMWRIPPFTRP